ncbi:type 4a pilus biogenesis protein PilO [Planctomycetales bacterium ZRK34]|nr:type 4a pilus biogenesis protein PilO [Planctomycetales bacterium ZRK34]
MRINPSSITLFPMAAAVLIVATMVSIAWALTSSKQGTIDELRVRYQSLVDNRPDVLPQNIQATIASADAAVKQIPASNDISQLLAALGRDLAANQTTDRQITTGRSSGEAIQQIPIQIRFKADFESTCRLLDALEQYSTPVRVDHMRMQRAGDDSASLDVELNLSTFFGDLKRAMP